MLSTFETRLDRRETGPETGQFLSAFAELYGTVERSLYAERVKGGTRNELKRDFQRRFGINARQFNSVWTGLDGKIRARKEGYKREREELESKIRRAKKDISKAQKKTESFVVHQKKRRLIGLGHRLERVKEAMKRDIPPLCFGSKKRFRAQFDGREHSGWLGKWRKARSSQIYLVGSKDETAGCQVCQLTRVAGQLVLNIRVPSALQERFGKGVSIPIPAFKYGQDVIDAALESNALRAQFKRKDMQQEHGTDLYKDLGRALTYRFVHDKKGWRILVSVEREKASIIKVSREALGGIGIDINVDHVALVDMDRHGNPVHTMRIPWNTRGKSTGQSLALTRDVAKQIVTYAREREKPIIHERLDFKQKKRDLKTAGENRRLSSFAYSTLISAIQACAFREGVETFSVNPAYTSVIGRVKFARRYGLGSHQAAALAIARRHFRFNERVPMRPAPVFFGRYHVTFWPLEKMAGEHVWKRWARVNRNLQRQIASVRRSSPTRSSGLGDELDCSPAQAVAGSP
ncbi:MAG: IS200/IS605 family accessory protein TnpB-related protein [Oceanipulchritudo sp.]